MEYQHSGNSKEYKKEFVKINCQLAKIIRNPKMELADTPIRTSVLMVVFGIYSVAAMIYAFSMNSILIGTLTGVVLGLEIQFIILFVRIQNFKKSITFPVNGKMEIDDEGVVRGTDTMSNKLFWNGIRCIRVYKYSMVFVPAEAQSIVLVFPVENLDNTVGFMKERGIDIPVITSKKS